MEKSSKRKIIIAVILLIGCIALISAITPMMIKKFKPKAENVVEEDNSLKDVGYNSSVEHWGYTDAEGMSKAFVEAFSENDGYKLASITNLQSQYIYDFLADELTKSGTPEENLKEEIIKAYDAKYEEVMRHPKEFKDFILMQYDMETRETEIIQGMPEVAPTYTLLNEPQIEDITTYLSKMTLVIHVESAELGLNEDDTLELMLLHRDGSYKLMSYTLIDSVEK